MNPGKIIFLNGTSSAGKTTIARALLDVLEEPYVHTGIDQFLGNRSQHLLVYSDGREPAEAEGWLAIFRDDALIEVRIGPVALRLITGMYQAIAAFAAAGNNTIVDDVIYDQRVLAAAVAALHHFPVWFVGLRCPLEVVEQRERQREERRAPGGARFFHARVHAHRLYDLEVDTAAHTPEECARQIKQHLQTGPAPNAFRRLHQQLVEP